MEVLEYLRVYKSVYKKEEPKIENMATIEKTVLETIGKRKEELKSEDLNKINKFRTGTKVNGKHLNKNTAKKLRTRLRSYVVENHALEALKLKRGELDGRHLPEIKKLDAEKIKKTGIEMGEKEIERLLPKTKENLLNNIDENRFLKIISVNREELSESIERIDTLIYLVTPKHWAKKYGKKIKPGELAEIKKRVKMIKNKKSPGR